ncbi:DUF3326 domain-containing protein [bacterium]|nr:DUF3326 domain-containing protein [bacterium]
MTYENKKLGAFIVPTGIGASIGGYAGDASTYARKFSQHSKLIVNPNVVNAGGFSGITDNMFYVEGYSIDSFFKGEINLIPSENNKIGIIYDKAIPQNVLNVHINTQNAVKTVYGIDIKKHIITEDDCGVEFYITDEGISTGRINNISAIENAAEKLICDGCEAIAIVSLFNEPESENEEYSNGIGVDPVGGVEAIISHCISKKFKVPCAHSPAFVDYQICSDIVNPKSASEYITPTFLPCILIGLSQAPKLISDPQKGINIKNLDYLVMPYNSLGSIPVLESIKHDIQIYAVRENKSVLNVTSKKISAKDKIIEVDTYDDILKQIL